MTTATRASTWLTSRRAVGITVALAVIAVLPRLGAQPLSWDEAVTLSASRRSLPELTALLQHTDAPLGLYYALIHGWLDLLGAVGIEPTAMWLRLPSALGAIGAVGLLTVLAARWFDARVALLAGALFAVHPMLTFYAQDARPYALVTCAYLASTWALLRALDRPSVARLGSYALLATVTIYLQLFAVYALAAHVVLVAGARGSRRRWAFVAVAVAAATTPLLLVARREQGELAWIPRPSLSLVARVIEHMFGGITLLVVLILLAALAIRRGLLPRDRHVAFLGVWLAVPIAALIAVDFAVPDLVARYGLVTVPAAVLLAAAAARGAGRAARVLVVVAVVVAAATTGVQQARPFKYEDYRSAADAIGDLARPGDAVMFLPISTRVGFEPYATEEADVRNVADLAILPGHPPTMTNQIGGIDRPPSALVAAFRQAPTIFLLGDTPAQARRALRDPVDLAQQQALANYRITRSLHYGVLNVTVLQRA